MSATTRNQVFTAVHTVGGLLPADMLVRISEGKDVPGSKPADYGLPSSRSVRDEAERSWEYLKPLWRELRKRLPEDRETGVPASDPTGLAENDWLTPLWRELGFGRLTHIGAAGITADSDAEKKFPVSHRWHHALIHQTAWNAELDKRPGGAGTVPPQSMLQECLNRTGAHLWGVLTNGRQLRLLRDSSALATASYVEFDLEAIFDGELFSEFALLYRLVHVSRFEAAEGAAPSSCWLEKWRTEAIASGTRALDQLRKGVQEAITALGTGFLRHPENAALRKDVDAKALHNALLRLVYRLLFLFVAEDRDALHAPDAGEQARQRYATYFSSARLRTHARRRRGTAHSDLYQSLCLVLDALGDENGCPELGLPGLGGIFDDDDADAPLHGLYLSNECMLTAIRHLTQVRDAGTGRWRSVDYRHLGAEELGSIYESLLELVPQYSVTARTFTLVEVAGNTRKTTGSYYTPSSLIDCLLDSALEPVIDNAVKRGETAALGADQSDISDAIVKELLSLTVCDPACGSGHFLVAAARRIARRVAAVRERNPEPTLEAVRHALHEVVARCIYGVDLNPMAVELAKVSLWLEALEPGKPLGFLDAHVKRGNALIGATPALLLKGIPDEAYKPIQGDDKKVAKSLERQNKMERTGQRSLFELNTEVKVANTAFATGLRRITTAAGDTLTDVRGQQRAYRDWAESMEYMHAVHIADAWCAAFMWEKTAQAPQPVTHDAFHAMQDPEGAAALRETHDEIFRLRDQYNFFHWHLEFPNIFTVSDERAGLDSTTGWAGGFDCILGNPPWERIRMKDQEFFAQRDPAIASAPNAAARKRMIDELPTGNPELFAEFSIANRRSEGESHFLRSSGRYPLTGRGDINTYAAFAENGRTLLSENARVGVIVPTGIATDATTQFFFSDLVNSGSLVSVYDFENREKHFPDVGGMMRFCLLTAAGPGVRAAESEFAFFLRYPTDLDDSTRRISITPEEIALVNPNTGNCPVFPTPRDARIAIDIYRRNPVLINEGEPKGNPWGVVQPFMEMFHMTHSAGIFLTSEDFADAQPGRGIEVFSVDNEPLLPLYEAKLFHHFDHRWATYEQGASTRDLTANEKGNAQASVIPRYWVRKADTAGKIASRSWSHRWLIALRGISRATDDRTAIGTILPFAGAGNSARIVLIEESMVSSVTGLVACLASFAFDYVARLKISGANMNSFIWKQLPVVSPERTRCYQSFITRRVIELLYTTYDMAAFASDLGDDGAPFRWNEERRRILRAELDALYFHLYGIERDDVEYIMDSFPVVRRKDEAKYGTYRTKALILDEYDRMAAVGLTLQNPLVEGENYTSTLTPPPGQGPRHPA
ncbi:N-6 DNA methylase [Streptomyces gilvifuscus]|uniref:site-specific DNA-methyltransferase (adenine-specific) n=1 Tax=Streptomyces gilvifuscus TaxID=1550617 RepID=A0ABT5FKF8_9ACTN|nr:DNA methyltransferase [Streptomyces gilvifuscus]MDC2953006.1 N-6 DNA methylase [Streptomyces gilvifuscus]